MRANHADRRMVAGLGETMSGYSRPWRRPRKIGKGGPQYCITMFLSQEDLDVVRSYGEGFSLLELSGAYLCDKATILKTLRECMKNLACSAKPVQKNEGSERDRGFTADIDKARRER